MKRLVLCSVFIALISAAPARTSLRSEARSSKTESDSTKKKERKNLPLEPGRNLSFTADEGTWISVDVSPDGQTLVFDLLGDLYTLPITGGKASRLTSGMAYDTQPRYSPDGKSLVFLSDSSGSDNVWVLDLPDKKRKALTESTDDTYRSPEWTPDGDYVVVAKGTGPRGFPKLFMLHREGGSGAELITKPERLKTVGPAFGKDERYIWFSQRMGSWQYNAVLPQYQIARYDRDTGKSTVMTTRIGSALRPTLSPDGKYLVYATRYDHETGLRIRDLQSGDERWLAYPVQHDDQESKATGDVMPGFSFTPDSKAIVASYGGKLWRVPVDGSPQQNIPFEAEVNLDLGPEVRFDYKVDQSPTFLARQIRHAVPSPDGKRLAFTSLDRLWVMDLPDGEPKRLTNRNVGEYFPAWSPDGKWLAFATWTDTDGGHIFKQRSNGYGTPVQLTKEPALYRETVWSPNGTRIVAIRTFMRELQESLEFFHGGQSSQFVYLSADGGPVSVIAPTEGRTTPHFSEKSGRIYAYGEDGLVSFRWDGSDLKTHVKVTGVKYRGNPMEADLAMVAPKGDRALVLSNWIVYTITLPYLGGETPTVSIANPGKTAFPSKKLTEIGAHFPVWSADATKIHWTIGNAFVTYDLEQAKAFADSVEAAENDTTTVEGDSTGSDTTSVAEAEPEDEDKTEAKYKPAELRIEIKATRDIPNGTVVLRGARAITMKGHEIIDRSDIVVTDNRIVVVGPQGQVEVPPGAREIDVSGKTILPGFVDTHAHLRPALDIHVTQPWAYLANLAYGVTTTRDPQTGTTDVLSYSDLVETGEMLGPRIYSTGPGVFRFESIKNQEHARDVLRRYSDYYDTKTFKMYLSGNRQQRQWLIIAAKELQLMPTTEGGLDFKQNITHAIDGYSGLEHSLPIFPIYNDVKQLFVKSQITHTPTLLVSYGGPFGENYYYTTEEVYGDEKLRRFTPHADLASKALRRGRGGVGGGWFHKSEYVFYRHAKFVADLIAAGGRSGVGSHGQLQGLGYHWELWSIQSGGLSTHDALRVATIYGAEAIGFGKDLGSIEAGKLADLVILNSNPIDDIRKSRDLAYVMKNGRLYEADTLDEIWPRTRKMPKPYWRDDGPATEAGIR